jgi:hypothetical protein
MESRGCSCAGGLVSRGESPLVVRERRYGGERSNRGFALVCFRDRTLCPPVVVKVRNSRASAPAYYSVGASWSRVRYYREFGKRSTVRIGYRDGALVSRSSLSCTPTGPYGRINRQRRSVPLKEVRAAVYSPLLPPTEVRASEDSPVVGLFALIPALFLYTSYPLGAV